MDIRPLLKRNTRSSPICSSYAQQSSPPLSSDELQLNDSADPSLLTTTTTSLDLSLDLLILSSAETTTNNSTNTTPTSLLSSSPTPSSPPASDYTDETIDTQQFFRLLIDQAHEMPIHDFQLSPSFLNQKSTPPSLDSDDQEQHRHSSSVERMNSAAPSVQNEEEEQEDEEEDNGEQQREQPNEDDRQDEQFERLNCELETEEEFQDQPTIDSQPPFLLLDDPESTLAIRPDQQQQSGNESISSVTKSSNPMIRIKELDATQLLPTTVASDVINAINHSTTPTLANNHSGNSISVRPAEKVYLGSNFFRYNDDGAVKLKCPKGATVDQYLGKVRKRIHSSSSQPITSTVTNATLPTIAATSTNNLLKQCSTEFHRNNCLPGNFVKSKFVQNLSYHKDARPRYFDDHSDEELLLDEQGFGLGAENIQAQSARLQQIQLQMELKQTNELLNQLEPEQDFRFASLKAANSDRIVKLYAVQTVEEFDLGQGKRQENEQETQILILVQHHFVNIWFKMDQSHWKNDVLTTKKDEKIFTTELVRFPGLICLFCLATDMQSIYLKYCKIDLEAQNACYLGIETFKNISIDQFDFIHLGQITQDKIAISIPRQHEPRVDLFMYQLEVKENNLTNLKKSLLHTFDRTSECRNNCVFRIQELPDRFVCVFDQNLHFW